MDLFEALKQRHSVREFTGEPLGEEVKAELEEYISALNAESGLNMQLVVNEPKAFGTLKAKIPHYGFFRNAVNYVALTGIKSADSYEKIGYYGEHIVLKAQQMGLRTCWAAGSYKRVDGVCELREGEKILSVIAIGYGAADGKPHRSKDVSRVVEVDGEAPEWFYDGVRAALLAPTAINQQRFVFAYKDGAVTARALSGPFSDIDLGIVKYHFEIGSRRKL